MASQAYNVLHEWAHVPGADEAGIIDGLALETWVKGARKLLKEFGRDAIGDSRPKFGPAVSTSISLAF